ncbi:MAG: hypothetical protein ACK2T3_17165 [Candidatus Promineifilaceae bacterium]|jgi:hypothetical protein
MDLVEVGIVLKCLCGAGMNSDMANVLFSDRGMVKVGRQPVHCPVCGAVYRQSERLKYELAPMEMKVVVGHGADRHRIHRSYAGTLTTSIPR